MELTQNEAGFQFAVDQIPGRTLIQTPETKKTEQKNKAKVILKGRRCNNILINGTYTKRGWIQFSVHQIPGKTSIQTPETKKTVQKIKAKVILKGKRCNNILINGTYTKRGWIPIRSRPNSRQNFNPDT